MRIDLTPVFLAALSLISGLVTTFLIPLLKQRLSGVQQERLSALIRVGVYAARQLYSSGEGMKKKAYVCRLLEENGYAVDTAEIDARIEAAVQELRLRAAKPEG